MTNPAVDQLEAASPLRRGVHVWYAAFGSIPAWIAHLVFEASVVQWAHTRGGLWWVLDGATVVCALATVLAIILAARLVRIAGEAHDTDAGDASQIRFLGQLGVLVGAIDLALILLEGGYVLALPYR